MKAATSHILPGEKSNLPPWICLKVWFTTLNCDLVQLSTLNSANRSKSPLQSFWSGLSCHVSGSFVCIRSKTRMRMYSVHPSYLYTHASEKRRDDHIGVIFSSSVHANIHRAAVFAASTQYHGAAGSWQGRRPPFDQAVVSLLPWVRRIHRWYMPRQVRTARFASLPLRSNYCIAVP
jgi:hypothetical protein